MVNTTSLMHANPYVRADFRLPWPPPKHGDDQENSRLIPGKIWDLARIQDLAQAVADGAVASIRAITSDCRNDMQLLQISDRYAAELLLLLVETDYRNSRWCHTGATNSGRPELGWVPCDAYKLAVRDDDVNRKKRLINYYIKLCLSPTGAMVLLISLHETN